MATKDYTKELGLHSQKKTLPRPIAYGLLVLVAVGMTFGVAGVLSRAKEHQRHEKPATAAAKPVPVTAPAEVAAAAPAK